MVCILLVFENVAICKRCGSQNTRTEVLIPERLLKEMKGKTFGHPVEIFCYDCGKINRTKIKMTVE